MHVVSFVPSLLSSHSTVQSGFSLPLETLRLTDQTLRKCQEYYKVWILFHKIILYSTWETFEGENFHDLVKNTIFVAKTFADCSLLPCQKTSHPQILQCWKKLSQMATKRKICRSFLPWKFPAIRYAFSLLPFVPQEACTSLDWIFFCFSNTVYICHSRFSTPQLFLLLSSVPWY